MARVGSGTDLVVVTALVVVLIILALTVWPGYMHIRPRDIAGYWVALQGGAMYEVRPGRGRTITVVDAQGPVAGRLRGLRGVRLELPAGGGRDGRVDSSGRRIYCAGGEMWVLQGILGR